MAISSFYGLQTSLRGLLAQQRALDTTGHNIANASTVGYSRQEAVLAASTALAIAQGAVQGGAGAHIGSGVDVLAYRRVRDTFLDLQYRAQATRLGEEAGRAQGLDRAELALAEPSDDGINKQLSEFWSAWADLANAADDPAARTSLLEKADSLADAFGTVDAQLELVGQQAADEYAALTAAGGEIDQIGQEIAALNDTIQRFVTAGDTPNDLMDQRDQLLDKLATYGTTSIVSKPDGSV
ncbi:MAG TPA: flagellar hook-associated protein FlgK, partial [Solirubrobacteraceae bacterium]|nr:flagellar hook-associated protein FlgK [Solirubrobacteraceae bacterium]